MVEMSSEHGRHKMHFVAFPGGKTQNEPWAWSLRGRHYS